MSPYDRVMALLNGKRDEVDRVPCINPLSTATSDFMKATGAFWPEAHKDPEKMAKLAAGAHRICGLECISVPFDVVVEAEIFGASIEYHEGKIKWPSVREFRVKDVGDLMIPEDVGNAGRVPVIIEAIKTLKKEYEGRVPINAYISPPFTSISSYLVDLVTFLVWLRTKPDMIHDLGKATLRTYEGLARVYKEAGADIITFHEMGGGCDIVSPNDFEKFIKPYLRRLISQTKSPRILSICGSAGPIIGRMVECGTEAISIDERTPVGAAREDVDKIKPGYPLIGNLSARDVIHEGPVERIRDAVKRVLEEGISMVAPGCDFWIETPTEHIKAFVDATIEFGSPPPWKG